MQRYKLQQQRSFLFNFVALVISDDSQFSLRAHNSLRISCVFVCFFVNSDFYFEYFYSTYFSPIDCKKYLYISISGTLHVFEASVFSSSREIHGVMKIAPWDLRDERTWTVVTVWVEIIIFIFASNLN